jgi:hypothetical protein
MLDASNARRVGSRHLDMYVSVAIAISRALRTRAKVRARSRIIEIAQRSL